MCGRGNDEAVWREERRRVHPDEPFHVESFCLESAGAQAREQRCCVICWLWGGAEGAKRARAVDGSVRQRNRHGALIGTCAWATLRRQDGATARGLPRHAACLAGGEETPAIESAWLFDHLMPLGSIPTGPQMGWIWQVAKGVVISDPPIEQMR